MSSKLTGYSHSHILPIRVVTDPPLSDPWLHGTDNFDRSCVRLVLDERLASWKLCLWPTDVTNWLVTLELIQNYFFALGLDTCILWWRDRDASSFDSRRCDTRPVNLRHVTVKVLRFVCVFCSFAMLSSTMLMRHHLPSVAWTSRVHKWRWCRPCFTCLLSCSKSLSCRVSTGKSPNTVVSAAKSCTWKSRYSKTRILVKCFWLQDFVILTKFYSLCACCPVFEKKTFFS